MKNNLAEIIFILDRSGSMAGLEEESVSGFNSMLQEQKSLPGDALLTLHLFDDQHEYPIYRQPIQEVKEITQDDFQPRGMTALYDAIGITTEKIGKELAAIAEVDRPSKVVVAIFTDGCENCSDNYNLDKIKELITRQQNVYSWEYLFLSSDISSHSQAQAMGFDEDKAALAEEGREGYTKSIKAMSASVSYSRTYDEDLHKQKPDLQALVDEDDEK